MRPDCEKGVISVCRILADYAAFLWECGATCVRIDKNVRRMADRYGYRSDIQIFPRHITVRVSSRDDVDDYAQYTSHIKTGPVSYRANAQLSRLSWDVAEGKIPMRQVPEVVSMVRRMPGINHWYVMLLVVLANASFCRLFGGDIGAMAIVAVATLVGYTLKILFAKAHIDVRLMMLTAAYVSSVIGSVGFILPLTGTPDIALGTSVLYLIPGIPYINSVSDMLEGHYLCFFSRLMNALILTGCIATGMTVGFMTMNLNVLS